MRSEEFQYVEGQARPTFPHLLAEYEKCSAAAVQTESCSLDVRYGSHVRQTFDFFEARGSARGALLYFHAGYWQSRDKSTFRFIAPAFTRQGLNVALVNYPLCPSVSLAALVNTTREAIPAVLARSGQRAGAGQVLIVAGHSAGAHIAVELALTPFDDALPSASPIDGVLALSGVFDLLPLVNTSLNAKLGLDAHSAFAESPLYRCASEASVARLPPALFVVGADETPAFIDQSERMHQAWLRACNASVMHIATGADHFSLLQQFVSQDEWFSEALALLEQAHEHRAVSARLL
jgi:arylformamidase